jgi:hypothetical protein
LTASSESFREILSERKSIVSTPSPPCGGRLGWGDHGYNFALLPLTLSFSRKRRENHYLSTHV